MSQGSTDTVTNTNAAGSQLLSKTFLKIKILSQVRLCTGGPGSGVGKGGGGGGAVREAGGTFGKMEAVNEDQFFYNQQKEQLAKLK